MFSPLTKSITHRSYESAFKCVVRHRLRPRKCSNNPAHRAGDVAACHNTPQPAFHQVSLYRIANRLGDDQPDKGVAVRLPESVIRYIHDESTAACFAAVLHDVRKSVRRRHAFAASERHSGIPLKKTYAETFARPLPRRAERMARPARVRMRARKPCTFARRRLLG